MNQELRLTVVDVGLDILDINGFKYNLSLVEVGKMKDFKMLTPIFTDVDVGDHIITTDWVLTQYRDSKPPELCIRVDKYEISTDPKFEVSQYCNSVVTGMFLNSPKCMLRCVGPSATPFYMATLKIKDAFGQSFDCPLVAFKDNAKALSTVTKLSVIKCVVTVRRCLNKEGFELAICSFEVVSQGRAKPDNG